MSGETQGAPLEQVARRSKSTLALGALFVAIGIAAIVVPVAASVTVALFIGWLLLLGAMLQVFGAFSVQDSYRMAVRVMLAVLMAAAGIYLIVSPLKGTVTLTVVLCAWLGTTGLMRLLAAFRERGTPAAGMFAISGALSLILGLLIALKLPSSGAWAIGLLVGIDFVFFGWTLISIALAARRVSKSSVGVA
jgi:uncharacterized membrane protein HdeD (DUF308 family)